MYMHINIIDLLPIIALYMHEDCTYGVATVTSSQKRGD